MATCPRMSLVTSRRAFRSSKTAVKVFADSTEPRPRRSRANYKLKDCVRKQLQGHAQKQCIRSKKEAVIPRQKIENGAEKNLLCNKRQTVVVVKSPVKNELKRKRTVGPKQKKPRITDSTSGEEDSFEVEGKQTSSVDSNQNGGCRDRLLMRQWLEAEANGGNIPGLRWFDQNEKLIQITWRHGSRSEWSTSDVMVFKCWAQHTGRYNARNHDYKRWKANFRCALNSLQDVKEVAEKRSTKSHDPYKVYRLLPAIPPKKRRRESVKSSHSSSAESTCTLTTEEVIQADDIVGDLTEPTDPPLTPDLFQHLMPFSNSSVCEQILSWPSVDPVYDSMAAETLEPVDAPLTYVDHCYADMEPTIQLNFQPFPPSPPPAPFNHTIPVPVQDLIESSEEFYTETNPDENIPVLGESINVSGESIPVSELLSSSCDVYISGEMNNMQAYTISSTNDSNLQSILQAIFNVPAFSLSGEITSLDQNLVEQT